MSAIATSRRGGKSRVGQTAGECAALCCCCPCAVVDVLVLAVYRLPTGIWRKKQRSKRNNDKISAENRREEEQSPAGEDDAVGWDDDETLRRFDWGGFWRSQSNTNIYGEGNTFSNELEKCDKAKAASSSADFLRAVSKYDKLDSTQGVGKYVDQAEGYLRQYGAPAEDKPAAETEIPSGGDVKKPEERGEVGDYAKKAEELLGGTGEKSGAEGLLKAAG
ncbi:hypothetical protein SASPL_104328 [Salvia splendens]|uniref:Uncharacterized protein n=1 Tax=Salvia splendens TaxID=180675 RepID=A0A8X8YLF5_SALSN|nr:hypothetical protein SASPL_104328 [Salvia splendens]